MSFFAASEQTKLSDEDILHTLARGRQDPVWWVETVLGDTLWDAQKNILESLRDKRHTAVSSCNAIGKSFVSARALLWFFYCHVPSIIFSTAPTLRQVRNILWAEVGSAHEHSAFPLGGELLAQELRIARDWFAIGVASSEHDPERLSGLHSDHIFAIVDESSAIGANVSEAIDGTLSAGYARRLDIGNPIDPISPLAQFMKEPGISKFKISAFDTPNFKSFGITQEDIARGTWEAKVPAFDQMPTPYLISPQWVAERFVRWGPQSPMYRSRVLAEFPDSSPDSLIPYAWIIAAQNRDLPADGPSELGVDVARYGGDRTTIYHRQGPRVRRISSTAQEDTMQTAGRVIRAFKDIEAEIVRVDVVGIGAGVVDRLQEEGIPVEPFSAGESPYDSDQFANRKAEVYWDMRTLFENGTIDIDPGDEELVAELSQIKWKPDGKGRVSIERKEDAKRRGLPSPDHAEGAILACAGGDTAGDIGVTF